MRRPSRRRVAWGVLVAVVVGYQVWALWLAPGGRTAILPTTPPLQVPLVDGTSVGQSFRIGADSLERVSIPVAATTPPARGQLLVDLEVQQDEGWRRLFRSTVSARRAVERGRIVVAFPRQPHSRHYTYRVVVRGLDIPASAPVVALASRQAGDPASQFWVNETERWGDLALLAETAQATAYGRLRPLFPGWPDGAIAALLGLVLVAWNIVFARALWRAMEPEAGPPSDQLAEPPLVA